MDERLLPTEPIRQFLHYVEAAEIVTLVGTGAIAYFNGELVPTAAAIGTIVLLTGWHGYHWVKDKFNGDKSQFPPSQDSPGPNRDSLQSKLVEPMEFVQLPPDPEVEETLEVVHDAAINPRFKHAPGTGHQKGPRGKSRKDNWRKLHRG